MQNVTLWRVLLGVEKTVVEEIAYDEDERVLVASVRPTRRAASRCGRCASDGLLGTTVVRDGVGGGLWTWARSRSTSRRTRRE